MRARVILLVLLLYAQDMERCLGSSGHSDILWVRFSFVLGASTSFKIVDSLELCPYRIFHSVYLPGIALRALCISLLQPCEVLSLLAYRWEAKVMHLVRESQDLNSAIMALPLGLSAPLR